MDNNNNSNRSEAQTIWIDRSVDFTGRMLKNFSYDGESYHQKYYYPQVVHNRVARRKRKESDDSPHDPDTTEQRAIDLDNTCGGSSARVSGTCATASRPTWFVSPNSVAGNPQEPITTCQDNTNSSTSDCAFCSHSNNTLNCKGMSDNIANQALLGLPGSRGNDDSRFITGTKSSESVTSEDSVFSEDYTSMLDEMSGDIVTIKSKKSSASSEDADSSFSSTCSSTGTLEADGKEDGRHVEDVCSKDKVTSSPLHNLPLHSRKKHAQDLSLDIQAPEIDIAEKLFPTPDSGMDGQGAIGCCGEDSASGGGGDCDQASCNPDSAGSFYEDREFEFLKTEPVRRSTSLKTYKTPPGTPHRKKGVRFADALGLDLESVRHILNLEEPPEVPKSAMNDLRIGLEKEYVLSGVKYLSALFSQPAADPAFINRVAEGKVVLENCIVNDKDMTLSGTVRVANISFHKQVLIRYTTNNWLTSDDIIANYVQNSNDGPTDRFSFTLTVPKYFAVGQRLEFAVMFNVSGNTFWDNNFGRNYAVECYAKAAPSCESDNTWMHFL